MPTEDHIPVRVKSGGREVVASGGLVSTENNFQIQIGPLTFDFVFIKDSGNPRTEFRNVNERNAEIKLVNFENALPVGTTSFIEVGTLGGRRLYLSFIVQTLSNTSSRSVIYSFLLGDQING